ncbi:hypothetical protein [Agromyces sp. Leaf222]|uniref:hypothetical protein n=1 Tax=Agromyces sp. Leaf222 TaxID=1735688 RepID=UPI0006FB71C6|nr:hypothetical protein [Agromyces sp. Leaf222]KQM82989.1 hypothetical protein ASE68_06765 [Agromyces sp. Leaf222]
MTDDRDDLPAAEPASLHLRAELHERRLTGIRKFMHTTLLLAGEATGVGGPSIADLVVMRRATRSPVIRTKAGTLDEADALLRTINEDLERLSVEEFLDEWGHLRP